MTTPDIRVRLSADGVREVLDALRKVQREAHGSNAGAAKGVGLINAALGELRSLFPTIGFAAAATGIFLIGKNALNSADHLHKLQQSVGGTVEDLSAFAFGAQLAGAGDVAEKGLVRLNKSIGDLRRGTGDVGETFAEIGLTARDFIGKDAVHAFELVAQRIAVLPTELEKVNAVNAIFGKGMSRLVPLINAVGTQGFAPLRKEAERLGLVFSTDLARAAEEVNDTLKILGKRSEAIAIQFLSGFVGPFSEALKLFEDETANRGTNAIKTMGEAVGHFAENAIKLYLIVGRVIGAVFAVIEDKANNLLQLAGRVGAAAGKGAVIGAGAGAVLGSAGLGAGAVPGAAVGAAAGAITGGFAELVKPTPGSEKQHQIMQDLAEDIDRIVLAAGKTGPASDALKKLLKGGRGEGEGDGEIGRTNTRQKLAALESKLNLDRIKDLEEIAKRQDKLNADILASERKVADAKVAVNAETIAGTKAIEAAERELLTKREASINASAQAEIQIAKGKEQLLLASIKRTYGSLAEGTKLAEAAVRQSSREQLDIETKRYAALVQLQDQYLAKYRETQKQTIAIDKEVAEAKKELANFSNAITLEGLSEEQKKGFTFRLAQEKLGELSGAAVTGNLEKVREFRREAFAMANDLKQLGDAIPAERIAQEATRLFELGADARKLAGREAGDAAKKSADDIGKELERIKGEIDQFKANLVFEIVPTASKSALADLQRQIQDELKKEPFQITVRAKLLEDAMREGTMVPPGKAAGGLIGGHSPTPYSDNILIRATANEFMQPVRAVRYYGHDFMESIRTLDFPRFAEGGSIGGDVAAGSDMQQLHIHLGGKTATVIGRRDQVRAITDILEQMRQ